MIFIRLAKNRVINLALTAEVKKVTKKSMKVRSSGPDTPAAAVMRTLKWLQVNVRRSAGVGPSLSRQEIYARIDVEVPNIFLAKFLKIVVYFLQIWYWCIYL